MGATQLRQQAKALIDDLAVTVFIITIAQRGDVYE
jgi:hypothetical protein